MRRYKTKFINLEMAQYENEIRDILKQYAQDNYSGHPEIAIRFNKILGFAIWDSFQAKESAQKAADIVISIFNRYGGK